MARDACARRALFFAFLVSGMPQPLAPRFFDQYFTTHTMAPTPMPTRVPTSLPTRSPTPLPTRVPTALPTPAPIEPRTPLPTPSPTNAAAADVVFTAAASPLYTLDESWAPQFPAGYNQLSGVDVVESGSQRLVYITQRGNLSVAPVLTLSADTGALIGSFGDDVIGEAGAHGIKVQQSATRVDASDPYPNVRVWINDFTNHALYAFSGAGKHLLTVGTPGKAGNGTSPMQFDHLADTAIAAAADGKATEVYVSDGDGGNANRVVKLEVGADGQTVSTRWFTGGYKNPHSIALHPRTGLLFLADREQNQTKLLRARDGTDLGTFDCGIAYGISGVPFGVRFLVHSGRDLAFVAIMDNPQDGRNQRIEVLDVSGLDAATGAKSPCTRVQTLVVPTQYSGPHLLGIDELTGDVYAALVAAKPKSTVLRFKCTGCTNHAMRTSQSALVAATTTPKKAAVLALDIKPPCQSNALLVHAPPGKCAGLAHDGGAGVYFLVRGIKNRRSAVYARKREMNAGGARHYDAFLFYLAPEHMWAIGPNLGVPPLCAAATSDAERPDLVQHKQWIRFVDGNGKPHSVASRQTYVTCFVNTRVNITATVAAPLAKPRTTTVVPTTATRTTVPPRHAAHVTVMHLRRIRSKKRICACKPGSGFVQCGMCQQCPAGQYSGRTGRNHCHGCPTGKYQSMHGSNTCNICAFKTKLGATACVSPCPAGKFSPDGVKPVCVQCPLGKTGDSWRCVQCPAGTWQPLSSWLSAWVRKASVPTPCVKCPLGRISAAQGTRCAVCPPGKTSRHGSTCVMCPLGRYKVNFPGELLCSPCRPCPAGYFRVGCRGKEAGMCAGCPRGRFKPHGTDPVLPCWRCPPGRHQRKRAQATCPVCPKRKPLSTPKAIACVRRCAKGMYRASNQRACHRCPQGKYQSKKSVQCLPCANGTYSFAGSSKCMLCPVICPGDGERNINCGVGGRWGSCTHQVPKKETVAHTHSIGHSWYDAFARQGRTPR